MTDPFYGTSGPHDADIVLVGEAWGQAEETAHRPFVGYSGQELSRILAESGIDRDRILLTNVVPLRPPNNEMWSLFHEASGAPVGSEYRKLHPTQPVLDGLAALNAQLRSHPRRLVIAAGNYALWALSEVTKASTSADSQGRRVPSGIGNWRGSMWYVAGTETPLLPIYHPQAINHAWYLRAPTIHDLKTRVPKALRGDWRPRNPPVVWAPPSFEQARSRLRGWLERAKRETFRLASDIETARTVMTCIGFADSTNFAMTIPWIKLADNGQFESYWTLDEEVELVSLIRCVLNHSRILIEGQNFLYDAQYIDHYFAAGRSADFDTMLAQHLVFPGTPKGLDYLSSLYCEYHWYWKEDGKEWDMKGELSRHLAYNALDLLRTFEVATALRDLIERMGLSHLWPDECAKDRLAFRMTQRGVLIDKKRRARLAVELVEAAAGISNTLWEIIPQHLVDPDAKVPWFRSPSQQKHLFYDVLGMRAQLHRKTGRETLGKDALTVLPERYPEFRRIFKLIEDYRSLGVFHNNFIAAPLDPDGRMRCMWGRTETFRWTSSTNAFGRGTNLQNLPKGDEDD